MAVKLTFTIWLVIIAIGLVILGLLDKLPFTTVGEFTLSSFELDDYGEHWFSGSPISFVEVNRGTDLGWQDTTNKFFIHKNPLRPYVDTGTGALVITGRSSSKEIPGVVVRLLTSLKGKDLRMVAKMSDVSAQVEPYVKTIVEGSGCVNEKKLSLGEFHVFEWRSSSLQLGLGTLFVDGIKSCEGTVSDDSQMTITFGSIDATCSGCSTPRILMPDVNIWAVGQRLPFNCRIDTSHESLFLELFSAGSQLNLNSFAFTPLAFCKDSPVVQVASAPIEGVISSAEQFLKWGVGETVIVPDNQAWFVTYVADWKQAGLPSGCDATSRYLVSDAKCENEARIVVAEQNSMGQVEVNQFTESGQSISSVEQSSADVFTLEEAESIPLVGGVKSSLANIPLVDNDNFWFVIIAVIVFIALFVFWRRNR